MKTDRLKRWLDAALSRSPMQPFFRWRASRHLTVLAYHGIDDPCRFEQQLDYLVSSMHPVGLDELLAALTGRRGLPKYALLLTFDDGDRSLFDIAMPLLRKRGLPGVAFIVAGLLDTHQPFWWTEAETLLRQGGAAAGFIGLAPAEVVRSLKKVTDARRLAVLAELRQTAMAVGCDSPQLGREALPALETAGIAIGNHTLTHPCLPNCTDDKIMTELSEAHDILTSILGHAPRTFAYPNGDADNRVIKLVAGLGYEAAFLFDHRVSPNPPPHRFCISRVRVNSDTPLDRFRIIVSGLHPALHHVWGRH